jgi:hypothetical protein
MIKKGIRLNTTFVILGTAFVLVILGGRFIFNNTLPKDDRVKNNAVSQTATSSATTTNQTAVLDKKEVVATSTSKKPPVLSCEETLKADLVAKKQSYVKGQLLVTFQQAETYKSAKDVLAVYGVVVQNENDSQRSFAQRHLITAAVNPGQEFSKVCQLRNDSHIKYAGLDVYFGIHQ